MKRVLKRIFKRYSIHIIDGRYQNLVGNTSIFVVQEKDELIVIDPCVKKSLKHLDKYFSNNHLSYDQVKYVIATHTHLDHTGSIGFLMDKCPNAEVLCHPKTRPHLVDPTVLVRGSKIFYGDEYFNDWYGDVKEVSNADRVKSVAHAEAISLGSENRKFRFFHVDGHTTNHIVIHDEKKNGLFCGDSFGVKYRNTPLLPCFPPAEFDPDRVRDTLKFFSKLRPNKVFLAHYGEAFSSAEEFESGIELYSSYVDQFEDHIKEAKKMLERSISDEDIKKYLYETLECTIYKECTSVTNSIDMNTRGILDRAQKEMWNFVKEYFTKILNFEGKLDVLINDLKTLGGSETLILEDTGKKVSIIGFIERIRVFNEGKSKIKRAESSANKFVVEIVYGSKTSKHFTVVVKDNKIESIVMEKNEN